MYLRQRHPLLVLLALIAIHVDAPSQSAADVLRFYKPEGPADVSLLDSSGSVVHVWPNIFGSIPAIDLQADGTLFGARGTGVDRLAFDGTRLWRYRSGLPTHHDIEVMPNGNVLLIAQDRRTEADAIAAGRNPATVSPNGIWFETIIEVEQTGPDSGRVVWAWNVWDHLIQEFDPQQANYGVVTNHPELVDINFPAFLWQGVQFNHANGIDYDPANDWIVLSSPVHNEIWIIDHSTTTAEAAGSTGGRRGKGGDLLYRWGNPVVYRRGTVANKQLHFQHDPQFIPPGYPGEGNVTVFDNDFMPGMSRVVEIVLPLDAQGNFVIAPGAAYGPAAPVWSYSAPGFYSGTRSGAERLPNGNTLVTSTEQTWIFEVTPSGQLVWQHDAQLQLFTAHHTQRSMWSSQNSLSSTLGGSVDFSLEASSSRAGQAFVLLGSASGTSPGFSYQGLQIPLNVDGYLVGGLSTVGTGPFASWVGVLDASGGGRANFTLPPLPFLSGLTLHHAFVSADATTRSFTSASNADPLTFR